MSKRIVLILSLLFSPSVVALSSNFPLIMGTILAFEWPLEFAVLEKTNGHSFWNAITNKKAWLASVTLGALVYYVSKQYTPEGKLAWAVGEKKSAEECLLVEPCEDSYYPYLSVVNDLFVKFNTLQNAQFYLNEALIDASNDTKFEKQSAALSQEIEVVMDKVVCRAKSLMYTQQFFKEIVVGEFLGSYNISYPSEFHRGLKWAFGLMEESGDLTLTNSSHFACSNSMSRYFGVKFDSNLLNSLKE